MQQKQEQKKPLKITKKRLKDKSVYKNILLFFIIIFLFKEYIVYKPILFFFPTKKIEGIIINEKRYQRLGRFTNEFTYYYEFTVNKKVYANPSYDEKYRIGDTILIEYNETFPFINRIKEQE